jgi:ABC-2 type transport system ATP-binding protein
MILDIIKPDAGRISELGGALTEATKERIGYLPEERGLYHDMTCWTTLLFLGQLNGLSRATARERAEPICAWWSCGTSAAKDPGPDRGMGQKFQFRGGHHARAAVDHHRRALLAWTR